MLNSFGQRHGHLGRVDVNPLATVAAQCRLGARELPEDVRTMLLAVEHLREAYQAVHFGRAQNLRLELCRRVEQVLAEVDLLVTPTTPTVPFVLPDERQGGDALLEALPKTNIAVNTSPLDLTGHPALTVPSGPGDDDLPTGLQIIARRFDEDTVYRAGFAFEASR
jgi:amidase